MKYYTKIHGVNYVQPKVVKKKNKTKCLEMANKNAALMKVKPKKKNLKIMYFDGKTNVKLL